MTLYGDVPAYQFSSQEEVVRLISLDGSDQWTDDLTGGDYSAYMSEVISDATMTCLQYIGKLYDIDQLYRSYWVRRRATYIAAYHFTKRRGNPGLYGEDYNRCIFELQEVAAGTIQIPEIPFSSGMLAAMQNVVVDMRYLYNKTRVRQSVSTDLSGREYTMYAIPYEWL